MEAVVKMDNKQRDTQNKQPDRQNSVSTEELIAVLESRAVFYDTIASLYFNPLSQEQIDAMAKADFSAYADINSRFAEGTEEMARYLKKRNTGTRQELALDFTSAFVGTKVFEGRSAVPYKSVFTDAEGLLYGEGFQEVFKAYKKEAIKKREGLDLPDDHLSFMCEFMALMSRRAIDALKKGDRTGACQLLESSRDFLEAHIVSWFGAFERLANFILKTRFYKGVLSMTGGFFELDTETLDDLILVL